MRSETSRQILRVEHLLLLALIGFFMSLSGLWIHLNQGPPSWDDAWYLDDSLQMYDALTAHGPRGWIHYYLYDTQNQIKAPLICAMPTPIYALTGRNYRHALYLNVLLMPLMMIGVYAIARRYFSARAALLAVFVCGSLPQLYGLATWFMVEYGLAVFTVLAIAALIYSDDFRRTFWVVLFSAVCGLGLLQKITFPVFVALPAGYVLIRWIAAKQRKEPGMPSAIGTLAAIFSPVMVIAGPWYRVNMKSAVRRAMFSGYNKYEASFHSTGDPFTFGAVAKYLANVARLGIGIPYACAAILLVVVLIGLQMSRSSSPSAAPARRPGMPFRNIAILWGISFLIFVFGRNKLMRFIAPVLPLFAIVMGLMLDRVISDSKKFGWVLTFVILVTALFWQIQIYFQPIRSLALSVPDDPKVWKTNTSFMTAEIAARTYESRPWPIGKMLSTLPGEPLDAASRLRVMIGDDSYHFNYFTIGLVATQRRLPMTVLSTAYYSDADILRQDLSKSDYFLIRQNTELGSGGYNKLADVAIQEVSDPAQWQETQSPLVFPDGGTLLIYQNLHPAH
jgi:4-amino-4-deoxy-L-arabinose transferase-like glycosyltransferase